jgi:hypothetical protein
MDGTEISCNFWILQTIYIENKIVMEFTKSELMAMCKEGMEKYNYGINKYYHENPNVQLLEGFDILDSYIQSGHLTSLASAKKYFFEQTNNQYLEDSDIYKLYIECYCQLAKESIIRNGGIVMC